MSSTTPPSTPSNILILGATGLTGVHLTASLLKANPRFSKIVVFTSPTTAANKATLLAGWEASGVSVIVGDINNSEDVKNAYRGIDTVISVVGRGALQRQIELIRLAETSEEVQWFFPSEYGTDVEYNAASAKEKPHQVKLAVRRFVTEHVKRLRVVYLVTGPFFGMWAHFDFDAKKREAKIIGDGTGKIGFCTVPDLSKFLEATLRNPPATSPVALRVQSFVVTPNEVVAELERQTGEKWRTVYKSLAEFRIEEQAMWEKASPMASLWTLRRIWAEGGTLYDDGNDNELLGLGPGQLDSLEVAVRRVLEASAAGAQLGN